MKNWFTIHDPHPNPDWVEWHIYLQDKYKELAAEIAVGDRVFFYETKTTKQVQFKGCIGKMGLVHIGHVTHSAYPRKIEDALSVYNDGERKSWGVGIPTDAGNSNGFVPQAKVVKALGNANNYYFRGYAGGKGIKQIDVDEANEVQTLFERSALLSPLR